LDLLVAGVTSVQKRIMVAIRCSIRMEVPLGKIGCLLVSDKYVKYLIGIANNKMEANKQRTDGFFRAFQAKLALITGEEKSSEQINGFEPASTVTASLVPKESSDLQLDYSNIELGCIHEEADKANTHKRF
jgi:Methyltransferase TYW3